MIVVDTSVIAYFMIPGDHTASAVQVRAEDPDWIAPSLWLSEFRNVLRNYLRAGTLRVESAVEIVVMAEKLMAGRSTGVDSAAVLVAASSLNCTAYDAEFVVLARAAGVRLVTTDRVLLDGIPETAVHPDDFVAG